ncbi:MAG: D-amino acid dehydrogenase [Acetobacteraceae bacterium]
MRVVILGAGVVGVATAWHCMRAGHEVTVVDRQPGAGLETSFANAGQLSYGYSSPWAGPGVPFKALKWLAMKHRPLVLWPRPDPAMLRWLWQMLANCNADAYERNRARMLRLSEYSKLALASLRQATGIAYDGRSRGTLQVFRKAEQLDAALRDSAILAKAGIEHEILDAEGCIAAEPALALVRERLAGGMRMPGDETGDAHLFTQRLAALCAEGGVLFRYGTAVSGIAAEGGRASGVVTAAGTIPADAVVVAAGSYSTALLRPLGISIPVYPVKGYSLTIPVEDADAAPVSTVMDETYKVGITRLGDRIRVGGTAELAGFSTRLRAPRRATLEAAVSTLFPRGGDPAKGSFWTGLRPMTPDGTPIVGPTRVPGLFVNTGHGTLGWTMAAGSGRLMADLVSGAEPEIEAGDLSVARYAA